MTAQPCSTRMTFPAGSQEKCPPPAPMARSWWERWTHCGTAALHHPIHPSSLIRAQDLQQGGRQWKTNGDRGFKGKGWIQGRHSKAEGDLQGQQQFTQQVAQGRQGFTGAGEKCILWAFIRKLVSPSPDCCDLGRDLGADGAPRNLPLVLEVTDRPSWEPALSQHGCILQLVSARPQQPLGHSSVSLSHHCPGAVFQGQPWCSVPPGRLQNKPSGISSWSWGPFLPPGKPHSPSPVSPPAQAPPDTWTGLPGW